MNLCMHKMVHPVKRYVCPVCHESKLRVAFGKVGWPCRMCARAKREAKRATA